MRLHRAKELLECAAALAVIAGVPFFFWQQQSQNKSARVASAMQFATVYENDGFAALRAKVEAPWIGLDAPVINDERPSAAALAKLKLDIYHGSSVRMGDLVRLTDFYNAVLSCRAREICDDTAVDIYFHDDIAGFYCVYDTPLAEIATKLNRKTYLDAIRTYVGDCRSR